MKMGWYEKGKQAVRYWLLRRLPTCKETVAIVSQSFERSLSPRERVNLKLHFWICAWCQWYLEHLQMLRKTLQSKAEKGPEMDYPNAPTLSTAARERIKRQLRGN